MPDPSAPRPLAVVTGASSGIGLGMARALAERGHDLVVAADEDAIVGVARDLAAAHDVAVDPVQVDLAGPEGVQRLADAVRTLDRPVDVLVLNAGIGVNGPFVDTDLGEHLRLIGVNVTGAVHLAGLLLPAMAARGAGRMAFTSSIASALAGPAMSTYNASKTFLSAFATALRGELAERGVTVTTVMPGGTDTEFFARADMEDTRLGRMDKDDPEEVGTQAVEATLAGRDEVVTGPLRNRALVAAAKVLPDSVVGKAHAAYVRDDEDAGDGG